MSRMDMKLVYITGQQVYPHGVMSPACQPMRLHSGSLQKQSFTIFCKIVISTKRDSKPTTTKVNPLGKGQNEIHHSQTKYTKNARPVHNTGSCWCACQTLFGMIPLALARKPKGCFWRKAAVMWRQTFTQAEQYPLARLSYTFTAYFAHLIYSFRLSKHTLLPMKHVIW